MAGLAFHLSVAPSSGVFALFAGSPLCAVSARGVVAGLAFDLENTPAAMLVGYNRRLKELHDEKHPCRALTMERQDWLVVFNTSNTVALATFCSPAPGVAGGPRVGAVAAADAAADDARRLLTAQEIDWNEVLFVDPRQAVSCLFFTLPVLRSCCS